MVAMLLGIYHVREESGSWHMFKMTIFQNTETHLVCQLRRYGGERSDVEEKQVAEDTLDGNGRSNSTLYTVGS